MDHLKDLWVVISNFIGIHRPLDISLMKDDRLIFVLVIKKTILTQLFDTITLLMSSL